MESYAGRPASQLDHDLRKRLQSLYEEAHTRGVERVAQRDTAGESIELARATSGDQDYRYIATIERKLDADDDPLRALPPRQRQVADLAAGGATARQMAEALSISPETVRTHLRRIYERLGIANRVELRAYLQGEFRDLSPTPP